MKNKAFAAIVLSLVMFSQVQARDDSNRRGPPERPSFSSIDLDSNGEVSFDEFSSKEIPFGDHQTVFDNIDSNQDGVITEEEFESHKPPKRQGGRS